jgi:plasmid maintenance system antidote protein VapI
MENTGEISAFWVLIERALRKKGLIPTELTRSGDITWTSLIKYREKGMSPRQQTVRRLAEALGVHPHELTYAPASQAEDDRGRMFRGLWLETGIKMLGKLAEELEIPQARLEDCALGTASLTAGETLRLVEIIQRRNKGAPHTTPPDGGVVKRADVDQLLDSAAQAMDETDRIALSVLLRKRNVKQLLHELQDLSSKAPPSSPTARRRKA